jgi:serine/threonine-protein kinase
MASETMNPAHESIELVLANRPYRPIRFLGRGGVGEVWVVQSTRMGKLFALKVLHRHLVRDRFFSDRFELEAKATAALEHPNVVSVTDYWVADDGRHCLVMQLLNGVTLARELHERRRLSAREVISYASQALRALAAAHEKGLVHRDIKPENLFLHRPSDAVIELKVLDFGLARVASVESEIGKFKPSLATRPGAAVGSPRFSSPEALRGKIVDHRADIYSLGVVMYLSLVGVNNEFDYTTIPSFAPPSVVGANDCTELLDAIVLRAVQLRPEERFQSALDFLEALTPLLPTIEYSQTSLPRDSLLKF